MPAAHLAGNYAPVAEELTAYDLPVTGRVPDALSGWYLRNGPNPHDAASGHWFFGDGMVHGVRLDGGRATSYRNRWVRTKTFTDGAPLRDGEGRLDLAAGVANTHVVRHAGRTLALVESSFPHELHLSGSAPLPPGVCDLDTAGPYDFGGRLTTAMTAHPKTCPTTGEMHFFGYGVEAPYLTYHRADAAGDLVISRPVDVPGPTMLHDFNLTAGHVVFMDLPVVFDLELALAGTMPYRWDDGYGARLGVLRRDDPYGTVRWFDIDPCYVFHPLNAHDDGDRIVVHVMRYAELWRGGPRSGGVTEEATLWRWTLDLAAGTVREEQIDDRSAEFPRVDDRLVGLDSRFGHVTTTGGDAEGGALLRYDLRTGTVTAHEFGPGRFPAEASFAPADDVPGGAGWLLTYVYDAATDRSDLVILDAGDLAAPPVASVHLPVRVPYGFHGNWLADR
ncbi:carotenoid oxygenase family protein [Actinoallomurus sp. NBC_01490]|uniref:carotenoid oxygenase family protein n=1 Tax=Actinoallomurus sp. NBC_01490 TaxID=2903557 RepID=UPI002E35DEE6|nr:carotenoid oxygenase family protein [Actinoallomurus sp. NBC_01490]